MEEQPFQVLQEEAKKYVLQPERFTFFFVEMQIEAEDGKQFILYSDGDLHCTCSVWLSHRICSHTMATEMLLNDLLTAKEGNYAANARDVVPVT